jgi:hypothetical protein
LWGVYGDLPASILTQTELHPSHLYRWLSDLSNVSDRQLLLFVEPLLLFSPPSHLIPPIVTVIGFTIPTSQMRRVRVREVK